MTNQTLPTASIVVVNYNTPGDLPGCIEALRALDYPSVEIIVVENGAGGGPIPAPTVEETTVRYLTPGANLGFAGGANLGWAAARGEIIAVVNPDVRVRAGWLRALAAGLREHKGAGIAGGKLLYPDGRVQHAGGAFAFPQGTTAHIGRGEPDGPAFSSDREAAYVTGGALVVTREAWSALGGFDAGYWPVYFEDLDLCTRAWDAGYSVWYIAEAVATHAESSSLAHGGADYFRYYHRNRLRYLLRHYDRARLLTEFAPAEEARLRADMQAEDRTGSLNLYADPSALAALAVQPAVPPPMPPAAPSPAALRRARLDVAAAEALGGWRVTPQPFRSRVPGLAWLRTRLNNLWTRWYVDPILAQQVEYNAALARAVRELAEQVSGLEAALLVHTGLSSAIAMDPRKDTKGHEKEGGYRHCHSERSEESL
ncbi:MAG: glycosyltransferase family 2 protein [Chloroflexia bacterium]